MTRTAILGAGSWGTALVKILTGNGHTVVWWLRRPEIAEFIRKNRHNPDYLSDIEIDTSRVIFTTNMQESIDNASVIILAIPSAFLEQSLKDITPERLAGKKVFSAIKGIVPGRLMIIGEYLNRCLKLAWPDIGVITGPCHAEEVALEKLSFLTVASQDSYSASLIASMLQCRYIKTTLSDDIYGTEYAAVLKNIMAIASGICHSLGYGDNFQAVLVANAIQEIKRFIDAVHPIQRDISDTAYLGDLLVTCYSQFSRNRTFGTMIGKGYSVASAQLEMNMIAEGYHSVACICQMNKTYQVNLPICNAVFNIVYGKSSPRKEIERLASLLN
jgi:glycerol-3-phosphate dehydrogenase (NAD(P)+)